MSVQVSYKKQTLLGIIGLLILFLVVEIIANVWWVTQINCEFEGNEIFMNMDSEEKRQLCVDLYNVKTLGDELIPNQQSNSVTINSLGFRGGEFSPEKPDNVYRIFMLGGSTMFGHGATSDQTTIPGYMQDFFQTRSEFSPQIINGGIQGADSYAELKLIETKLASYSPNMVIVYDGWNDLRAETTAKSIHNNWNKICELGKKNNFDVIIALQPIAGFGNKILSEQELTYSKFGTNYNGIPLINSLSEYEKYTSKLNDLENCTSGINLRAIFDNELSPIYWDQGHVSDKGNSIVANALYNEILEFIPKDHQYKISITDDADKIISNDFENQIRYFLSNYKTSLMVNSIFSFDTPIEISNTVINDTSKEDFTIENKKLIFETQTKNYKDNEISIIIEILSKDTADDETKLKIVTKNNTDNSLIDDVTYFLKIYKDKEVIFTDFFFVDEDTFFLDVYTRNSNSLEISGNRQYDHNAIVVTTDPPIILDGPIFLPNTEYEFVIELRTLYDKSNWIFSLDDFRVKIVS